MKFFVLVLFIGLAAALPYNVEEYVDEDEEDTKTEIGKHLKDALQDVLQKIKDAIDHGKTVKEDLIIKAKELKEKLKELHVKIGDKLKELVEKTKERVRDWIRKMLEGDGEKRDISGIKDKIQDMITKMKEKLREITDDAKLSDWIRETFPDNMFREMALKALKKGREGLEKFLDFMDRRNSFIRHLLFSHDLRRLLLHYLRFLNGRNVYKVQVATFVTQGLRVPKRIMKLFVFCLLFGLAVALPYNGYYRDEGDDDGDDIRTELGQKLKEALDKVLNKMKDAIDHGKEVKEDLVEKAKELREKMKELRIKVSDRAKELIEKMKDGLKDWFRKLWDKDEDDNIERRDLDLKNKIRQLIRRIKSKLDELEDKGKIREFIENNVKSSMIREKLLEWLDKGIDKFREFLDKIDRSEKRSAESFLDHLIDVLSKVRLTTGEKIDSFVEFLKETYDGGKEVLKDKATFVRDLARHFLERAEHSGKEVAQQALKFFRLYKDDLGKLYKDVEEKVKEIVRQ
ncbi:probable DNA double-strand break repair Rad50 ATPase [Centruroides vittatus]|uniref:probable DNA double-strand break repair Rad50 ATPase n=1 Tax=Centruroides vittatus TaxID=120091 RepID=UPI00350FB4EB